MNLPFRPAKKKKLQASTARRLREADYTEEPNVKLSSAFVVVLALHIVAVGGIYAFNAIKAHQPPALDETDASKPVVEAVAQASPTAAPVVSADAPSATPASGHIYLVRAGDTIAKIAAASGCTSAALIDANDLRDTGGIHVGQQLTIPNAAAVQTSQSTGAASPALHDSGSYYTVKSGDTPTSIARKLHVTSSDLLRLNKIEDPKKLRIGLKLRVPARRSAASTT